ncbi:uncharacterized protein LACBIDRAFT_303199 [Laccaria bicolor S238N-H82]|uniref:Predicted protein n=1 Tax=Laccaria bicolor (strain S238N-H82 / ATCC MYA-4686) TaxID=486041 RepID=B0DJ41_LACBS|nr:uncharacterized protein LACBIDRAFT_303199 [Laccaria bicolor S238N-H82]EDR05338.1 predicted protein [Laccaria bicolor S238N-H82]|eukprot:XP_001883896.1 predicted protein [Laccaria bicolor S238N-H82]
MTKARVRLPMRFGHSFRISVAPKESWEVHAQKKSNFARFRPAVSPIIAETLEDGGMRGATPPPKTLETKLTPTTKARRENSAGTRKPKRKIS